MTAGALPLDERLFAPGGVAPVDLSHATLPPPQRPGAFGILDISEYVAPTSGGVRTYLMEKARYVEGHPGLRQVLLVPGDGDGIVERDGVRCYRLRGPRIPFQHTYRFLLATRTTSRLVAHERPDVIEVGSAYFAPWLVARARRRWDAPAVWFYHANLPRVVAPAWRERHGPREALAGVAAAYVRGIARRVQRVIVASDFVRRDLEAIGVEHLARVPLGVDLARFHPARRAHRAEVRARLGLPGDAPVALWLGRFAHEKHVHVAAAAWPAVWRRTGAVLAFVGAGPRRERLREAAAGCPGIRVLPFQADRDAIADLHAAADCFVATGPNETFGLAPLEALASGTPLLAADHGAVREHVDRSGAGRLFRVGDAGSLAEEAVALLGQDLAALGAAGRAFAEREHDWRVVFDRLVATYREVVRS